MEKVLNKEALLVIGSPMCTMFSRLQQMNFSNMDPEKRNRMMKDARDHLAFSMAVYQLQMDNGMYFLHEHPWTATSWDEDFVKRLLERDGVTRVRGDMCQFGMYQNTPEGLKFVKKPTGFMTNAKGIAEELGKKCQRMHSHVYLLNGRAKRAEVYPDELCYRID